MVRPMNRVGLRTDDLSVRYGGIAAVTDVSIQVEAGQVVGLIGPNGAGKTTTIDALSGFTPHRGRVYLGEIDISASPPHVRARAGLARTWQSVELFEDLTVRQHCLVAAHRMVPSDLVRDVFRPRRRRSEELVDRALDLLELTDVADVLPAALPHGRRKLVGVARALAAGPAVMLLDEPAAGLDSTESMEFGDRLRSLVADGLAVLLVDHDTQLVLEVCDRIAVLDFGTIIASGTPAQIRDDARVVEAYLGVGSHRPPVEPRTGPR